MTSTFTHARRIELLLNSLIGEHYARRALLSEMCDELQLTPELAPLLHSAAQLLRNLEQDAFGDSQYERALETLMVEFRALSSPSSRTPAPGAAA